MRCVEISDITLSLSQKKEQQMKVAWCKSVVAEIDIFFRADCNKALLKKYVAKACYAHTNEDFLEIAKCMIAEKDEELAMMVTDEDLEFCKDAFKNILSPTRDSDYEMGTRETSLSAYRLAVAQKFICPYCNGRMDFDSQKINVDHVWDRRTVGNGIKNNLVAAHKKCNMLKGNRHVL